MIRHFPFGLSLEPIQARSVAIITHCAPPVSNAWGIVRIFFPAAPVSGLFSLNSRHYSFLVRLRRPLCADLFLGIQHFSRLRLLLAAPSDNRWRPRESFNAVEDRCKQPPRHSHFGELERHIFRVSRYLRPDLDELLS